ncbi:MAG: hypothetical protein O3A46_02765 [Candidatus Poribacteria bacterium]|nr:hypothetical protein [Candidatus Poribacteria bacterium]
MPKRRSNIPNDALPAFSGFDRLVHQRLIESLFEEMGRVPEARVELPRYPEAMRYVGRASQAMAVIESSNGRVRALDGHFQSLSVHLAETQRPEERESFIFDFLSVVTPNKRARRGDRRAFKRYMGFDVAEERYRRIVVHEKTLQKLALDLIGYSIELAFIELGDEHAHYESVFDELKLQPFLLHAMQSGRRAQNQVAAFAALGRIVRALPSTGRFESLEFHTSRAVARYCLDTDENVWIQIGALQLMAEISRADAFRAFERRLLSPAEQPDDLFVRKAILEIIERRFLDDEGFELVRQVVARRDASDFVRVQLVKTLAQFDRNEARDSLQAFALDTSFEACPQARAQAVIEWSRIGWEASLRGDAVVLEQSIANLRGAVVEGDDAMVQRVAFEEIAHLCNQRELMSQKFSIDSVAKRALDALAEVVAHESTPTQVRRWAGDAWNQIVVHTLPEYQAFIDGAFQKIVSLRDGKSRIFRRRELPADETRLGRVLAYYTRRDFGVYVEFRGKYVRVTRGDRFRWAWWRIVHEARHLSPDKRQGFNHTVGRRYSGTIRAHSGIMGELTRTKVPGERFYIEDEDSWRRYLPLLDDYLSLCRRAYAGKEVRLFSSYGVTTIKGPRNPFKRWINFLRLSWDYDEIARMRNANPRDRELSDPRRYLETLRERFGFRTTFEPYGYTYGGWRHALNDPTLIELFDESD